VRSRSAMLGLDVDFYQKADVHIHVPEGATPKDGPSAGVGMCTSLISALTKIPVRSDVAMTGEITLRGEVLPIGGLKEKLLAAHRGGITTVLIPDDNTKDLAEIPDNIKEKLDIRSVKWIDEVLQVALTHLPVPLPAPVEAKPPEVIAGEKRRRKPNRVKSQVRAH
jgi:ATP-dependent Lon protease